MTMASFVSFAHFVKLSEFYQRSQPPHVCVACWRCLLGPRPNWGFQLHTDYSTGRTMQGTMRWVTGPVRVPTIMVVRTDRGRRRGRRSSVFLRAPHCHLEKRPGPTCHMVYRAITWSAQNRPHTGGGMAPLAGQHWAGGYPLVPEAKHEATVSPVSNARLFEVLVSV